MPKKKRSGRRASRPKQTAATSLMEAQDPNSRAYLDAYATPEMKSNLQQIRFAQPKSAPRGDGGIRPALPSDKTGANTFLPLGSSYPVSLHALLDADPAASAYLAAQPPGIRQKVYAANLQTAEELENYVKKLENRLDGRPPGHSSPENGHA